MLGQPVHSTDAEGSRFDEAIQVDAGIGNPFPGLRPFSPEECHLYFGREGQVDELLLKLLNNRFVTVMGYSGSGKSSLLNCGLIPVLMGGLVTESGPDWQVVLSRPGDSPFETLANSVVEFLIQQNRIQEEDRQIHRAIMLSVLRSGPDGLIEVARYLQTNRTDNIFILLDQFEELFREKDGVNSYELFDENQAYVNTILRAISQTEVPIFVSLGMRSDFIGQCAQFPGLVQVINKSNYLVPQMTREQKKMVIEGPVAVAGGRISQRLVKKLLNEVGTQQDQLPILQHAMMRTWDYWLVNHEPGEPIDIRHYNAIGGMTQALSQHANEAYDQLSSREKEIAEILFKSITEKNQSNQGMRRPCRLNLVAELAEASETDVIRVVDHFRAPGKSFLMPAAHVKLSSDSVIELSHESIMRIWNRLDKWVEEEYESAQIYKRISEAASMYQIGKTGLWRPPDLQLALNWQKKQRPSRAWAQRYDEAFERAVVFLDTSRITYEAELKNQEMLQRRMLRRTRVTAIVLGIAALIAFVFFFFAYLQKLEADSQTLIAQENFKEASEQKAIAEAASEQAKRNLDLAEERASALEKLNQQLEQVLQQVTAARADAVAALEEATKARDAAERARESESAARILADENFQKAQLARAAADTAYYLQLAQALEGKSVQEEDDDQLAGLLAMQGYHFHSRYGGKKYDPYVYRGLYSALTKLSGGSYNAKRVPGAPNTRIGSVVLGDNNTYFAAGYDGHIFKGDYKTLEISPFSFANATPNRMLAISPDKATLVNAPAGLEVQIFQLNALDRAPVRVSGLSGEVNAMDFLDNTTVLVASSTNVLYGVNTTTGSATTIASLGFGISSIDVSPDRNYVVAGSKSGRVVIINLRTNASRELAYDSTSDVNTVKFSPSGNQVAYGTAEGGGNQRGLVKLLTLDANYQPIGQVRSFTGHTGYVYDVEFSPDGKLLASAGSDRKLQMWVLESPDDLPIEMSNNNGFVWDIVFSEDSNYLIAGSNNSEIRVWPTDPSILKSLVCPQLNRNMTLDEWRRYVSNDELNEEKLKEFENTCVSLLIKDF